MIKVLINGACGRMGCEVEKLVDAAEDMKAAAKVDKMADKSGCYSDINDFDGEADVIIDFSNHLGTAELLDYAVKKNIPTVIATTGHTDEELKMISEAAKKIPVFHSANMSSIHIPQMLLYRKVIPWHFSLSLRSVLRRLCPMPILRLSKRITTESLTLRAERLS